MEPALLILALVVGLVRGLGGRKDRRARSTVARAFSGLPSGREARFAITPRGRFFR